MALEVNVRCSRCGDVGDGTQANERVSDVRKRLGDDGWAYRKGRDLCPDCRRQEGE